MHCVPFLKKGGKKHIGLKTFQYLTGFSNEKCHIHLAFIYMSRNQATCANLKELAACANLKPFILGTF